MDWKQIQQHPITFWILAFLAFFGAAFSVWSWQNTQPHREVSYKLKAEEFVNLDDASGLGLNVQGETVSSGSVWLVELYVWNSGNQEITENDFGKPLQLNINPKWTKDFVLIRSGIDETQIIGDLTSGFKFKSIFPRSGFKLAFLSKTQRATATVLGNINGAAPGTNGIVNQTGGIEFLAPLIYSLMVLNAAILVFFAVELYFLIWRRREYFGLRGQYVLAALSVIWFAVLIFTRLDSIPPF